MFHGAEKQWNIKTHIYVFIIPSVMFVLVTDAEKEKQLEKLTTLESSL